MNNIILEDNVIFLVNNQKYLLKINDNILDNGIIKDKNKFIKLFNEYTYKNKILRYPFFKDLNIIYNYNISINDLNIIKDIFIDIGFRNIYLKKEYYLVNKKDIYLVNDKLIRIFYIDNYNSFKYLEINKDIYNKYILSYILKYIIKNKNIIIIGNDKYLINIIDNITNNYVYYENKLSFFYPN